MPDDIRAALARRALAEIPKLLTLMDRTPTSATYGSFDRGYWHYRVMDFPCGMSQEFVLPLALVWSLDLPDNPYRGVPVVGDWIEAGIRYAARSAHADGSCDDYYPFERATGAAAFSLFAALEAAKIIGLAPDAEIDAFFERRTLWLSRHEETGELSNHEALIVLCLQQMAERFGGERFEAPLKARLRRLMAWQSREGWFSEYGGADLGYLSLTIGLLADLDRRCPALALRDSIAAAIRFFAEFVHPDGTVGGEYSSRGTLSFFPHGFEIAGAWMPEALAINDRALVPMLEGRMPCWSDDRIIGHHLWSWLLAVREFQSARPPLVDPPDGRRWFQEAKLLVDRRDGVVLVAAPGRGGVCKLFVDGALAVSDTGPSLATAEGRVAVTHLQGDSTVSLDDDLIAIEGRMNFAKTTRLTPFASILLRLFMLTLGRFFPNLVRRLLQRLLVSGREDAPFRFKRVLQRGAGGWTIRDEVMPDAGWSAVRSAGIGGFQVSTTTAMARVYRAEQLRPWIDLSERVAALGGAAPLVVERRYGREG